MEYHRTTTQVFKSRIVGLFGVLGPFVGWCLFQTLAIVFLYEQEQPLRQEFIFYASLWLAASYMFGVVPALVCGVIMGQKWVTRTSFIQYCVIGFCVGALSCIVTWGAVWIVFVCLAAWQQNMEFSKILWKQMWESTSLFLLLLIAVGGPASLVCTMAEAALHRYRKNWLR